MSETSEPVLLRAYNDPYLNRIQYDVLTSFLRFQMMHPEDIAEALEKEGIKATPGNYCECALAEYFRKIVLKHLQELRSTHYIEVQQDSVTIELDLFGRIVIPIPDGNVRRFIEDFDEELFPALMIESSEE